MRLVKFYDGRYGIQRITLRGKKEYLGISYSTDHWSGKWALGMYCSFSTEEEALRRFRALGAKKVDLHSYTVVRELEMPK